MRAALVSLAGAVLVLLLKAAAWWFTGAVSLLSDAAESMVNLLAAVAVMTAIRLAARGPDLQHPYGHQKAEYLSSVFEGVLILLAAGAILVSAGQRLWSPQPIDQPMLGVSVALAATLVNGALAAFLLVSGRRLASAALHTNGRHVLTDVWTSLGVVTGVLLVTFTGWNWLDPLMAIAVALHIIREGVNVLTANLSRLMDERLPADEEQVILDALRSHAEVKGFHRLRSRRSGRARFAEVDVFVDPELSVREAHRVMGEVEDHIHTRLSELTTTLHVEPFQEGLREGETRPEDEFPAEAR